MKITPYEIRSWWCPNSRTYCGKLYYNGIYECDVIFKPLTVTDLEDRIILTDVSKTYTLMRAYEK